MYTQKARKFQRTFTTKVYSLKMNFNDHCFFYNTQYIRKEHRFFLLDLCSNEKAQINTENSNANFFSYCVVLQTFLMKFLENDYRDLGFDKFKKIKILLTVNGYFFFRLILENAPKNLTGFF